MNKKILIIDDDINIIELLKVNLLNAGYDISYSQDGLDIESKIKEFEPDLVVLDLMLPGISGYEICSKLKEKEKTAFIPAIILSAKSDPVDKITGLKLGADDYLTKPFDIDEILVRIEVLLRRAEQYISINPLTHLPGNTYIMNETLRRLNNSEEFAFIYADLNNFKSYNDIYGFDKGDRVIKYTAGVIKDRLTPEDFIGHIGGDDFIVICSLADIDRFCLEVSSDFDKGIWEYYSSEDREKGYITADDRQGNEQKYPVISLSLGVVSAVSGFSSSYADIVDRATQMKKYAKQNQDKSSYSVDRRKGKGSESFKTLT